jgi:hypothetical protein
MPLLQGLPGHTAMHITRKAVMLILSFALVVAAGIMLRPKDPTSIAIHLDHASPAGATAPVTITPPPDIYQQARQDSTRNRALFLDNLLLALNTYGKPGAENGEYLKNFADLYATLARLLQDDNERVAEPAAAVVNVMALMQRTTAIQPVSESDTIKSALENVIVHGEHDVVRSRAIDAWVLLYPPDDDMVSTLEKILQGDMDKFPETQAAAFRAYGIYKRRYGYKLPDSTVNVAKNLLDHPSQSVRVKAEYALAEIGGTSMLPTLIAQLEQAGDSTESRMLTALILKLDNSQDTVDKLNRITGNAR